MSAKFTYLAIPYSDPNPNVRAERMKAFWKACAALIRRGDHVVSPMTLEPAYQVDPNLPYEWAHWRDYSLKMMATCDRLVVLKLDGWRSSVGVHGEIEEAVSLGINVEFWDVP